jgi:glycerophosphoryl diester phosphodiesterase
MRPLLQRVPIVIAHTGCEGTGDNTEASIEAAIQSGAHMLEVDIRTSQDGYPVLSHDPSINDHEGESLIIAERTYHELQQHFASAPGHRADPLAPWELVLKRMTAWSGLLNLDLKDEGSIERIKHDISNHGILERTIITGCDSARAAVVRSVIPAVPVLLNIQKTDVSDVNDTTGERFQNRIRELCSSALATGCAGINIEHSLCNAFVVDHAHQRFLSVTVWTVDQEAQMLRLLSLGVDAITTRQPAQLRSLVHGERQFV